MTWHEMFIISICRVLVISSFIVIAIVYEWLLCNITVMAWSDMTWHDITWHGIASHLLGHSAWRTESQKTDEWSWRQTDSNHQSRGSTRRGRIPRAGSSQPLRRLRGRLLAPQTVPLRSRHKARWLPDGIRTNRSVAVHVHNMDQATLFNKHSEHPHALPPSGLFVLGSISNGWAGSQSRCCAQAQQWKVCWSEGQGVSRLRKDASEYQPQNHQIRAWRAVDAAALQGKGSRKSSVFLQTPVWHVTCIIPVSVKNIPLQRRRRARRQYQTLNPKP